MQVAISTVVNALASNWLEVRRATALLYGLQLAAGNCRSLNKNVPPRPEKMPRETIGDANGEPIASPGLNSGKIWAYPDDPEELYGDEQEELRLDQQGRDHEEDKSGDKRGKSKVRKGEPINDDRFNFDDFYGETTTRTLKRKTIPLTKKTIQKKRKMTKPARTTRKKILKTRTTMNLPKPMCSGLSASLRSRVREELGPRMAGIVRDVSVCAGSLFVSET